MAKTSNKSTRKVQYRGILAKAGIRFEDCRVLAFTFERPLGPETFHLHLMNADPRPEYHLFDCWEKTAQVVIPNDAAVSEIVCDIATRADGKKTTPNLI